MVLFVLLMFSHCTDEKKTKAGGRRFLEILKTTEPYLSHFVKGFVDSLHKEGGIFSHSLTEGQRSGREGWGAEQGDPLS